MQRPVTFYRLKMVTVGFNMINSPVGMLYFMHVGKSQAQPLR